ncbi:MAG: hypothetical protein AB8B51_12850 [Sedimentitalea sp.]
MIETFIVALFALLITLYVQARMAAREIRRNRDGAQDVRAQRLVIKQRL